MSGLKSAWEISLEKSEKIDPQAKSRKKLTDRQKAEIGEIRKEYKAKIADKEVILQDKLNKLANRVPPEQLEPEAEELRKKFAEEKQALQQEMENRIEDFYKKVEK